jgi:hypothetical protein
MLPGMFTCLFGKIKSVSQWLDFVVLLEGGVGTSYRVLWNDVLKKYCPHTRVHVGNANFDRVSANWRAAHVHKHKHKQN